jgi:S-adenosylmethionine synthetase
MNGSFKFSSESVGEGHPDKVADYISDSILDACLAQDPKSRVACETLVKNNLVTVAGEITTSAVFDYNVVIRDAIRDIGYIDGRDDRVFHADSVFINNYLTRQSPDIKQGVDASAAEGKDTAEQGAGDQGIMFGYACNETPEYMPAAIMFAHRILRRLAELRKARAVNWLRPDVKSQVAVNYDGRTINHIDNVVVSTQHTEDVTHAEIRAFIIDEVIRKVLPAELLSERTEFFINQSRATSAWPISAARKSRSPSTRCPA